MARKILVNFGLLFVSGAILLIVLNVWNYIVKINELQKVSSEILSDKAIFYQVSADNLKFDDILNILPSKAILYNDLSWDRACKAIVYKGNMPNPPMLSGRFFVNEDIGNNVAVVGKNIKTNMVDQKESVSINGINYEVIGFMGTSYNTKLDEAIWVIMNDENINSKGIFTLDGLIEKDIYSFLGAENIWGGVLILDRENVGILEVSDRKKDYWIFPGMVVVTGMMFYIILMHRWFFTNENEIKTRIELGFSIQNIQKRLVYKSAIPSLGGVIISFISFCISGKKIAFIAFSFIVYILLFTVVWFIVFQYKDVKKLLRNGS